MDSGAPPSGYYLDATDGKRYGPADLATLREWVAAGSVLPETVLVDAQTGQPVPARDVPGLFSASGSAAPPPMAPPRPDPAAVAAQYMPAKPKSGVPIWAWAIVACIFGFCCCGVFGAILFPVLASARVAAKRSLGLTNMKQIDLAALLYANDNDDCLPPDMSSARAFRPYLAAYARNPEIFASVNPVGGEILGNAKLSGKSTRKLSDPETTLLAYDEKPWFSDRGIVGFADGHAQVVPFTRISALLAVQPFRATPSGSDEPTTADSTGGPAVPDGGSPAPQNDVPTNPPGGFDQTNGAPNDGTSQPGPPSAGDGG